MKIPPNISLDSGLYYLLGKIESFRGFFPSQSWSHEAGLNLRRQSLLGSSLFSARIEGNNLRREDLGLGLFNSPEKRKKEVANLYRSLNYVYENYPAGGRLTIDDLKKWHALVLAGLSGEVGCLRAEMGGVFDAFGNLIHLSVPPPRILEHLQRLLDYLSSERDQDQIPAKACLAHYFFEKIHPFLDANGRVGRLLLSMILNQYGYSLGGLLVLEEYLDEHRSAYYQALEVPESRLNGYLVFMLEALAKQLEKTRDSVALMTATVGEEELKLLPRRREILEIVREHNLVNFDFLRRRFLSVNERTLRFDLKRLVDGGFLIKRGETKGVFYSPRE